MVGFKNKTKKDAVANPRQASACRSTSYEQSLVSIVAEDHRPMCDTGSDEEKEERAPPSQVTRVFGDKLRRDNAILIGRCRPG